MTLNEIKVVLEKSASQKNGSGEFAEGYRAGILLALNLLRVVDTSPKRDSKYNDDDDTYL